MDIMDDGQDGHYGHHGRDGARPDNGPAAPRRVAALAAMDRDKKKDRQAPFWSLTQT
jgi:hypothetical protein